MPIEPGTKLGRYEILSQRGAGGMGEVFLARDAKLDPRSRFRLYHKLATLPTVDCEMRIGGIGFLACPCPGTIIFPVPLGASGK